MASLEQFVQLRTSLSSEKQTELYGLLVRDPGAAIEKMIAIGNEKDVSLTADEIKSYLEKLDKEDEFDDIELNAEALTAVSGGVVRRRKVWEKYK